MAQEIQNESSEARLKETAKLLDEYKQALSQSGLPQSDIDDALEKLGTKPADQLDPKDLKSNIDYVRSSESKEKVKEQSTKYSTIIDDLIKQGLFSKDPKAKAEYMKWLMEHPFDEREKIIQEPFFKMEERKKASDGWKRIPEAERKNHPEYEKLGIEEKLVLVEKLTQKHKSLKAEFLGHPVEVQKRYLKQFANSTFAEREKILQKIREPQRDKEAEALRKNFLKLPRMVQAESKDRFNKMGLDQREQFLKETERQVLKFTLQYRTQIEERQRPDKDGLTLFSSKPESQAGSSASSYMKWFKNDLTLAGMGAAVNMSDLRNPVRETERGKMRDLLPKIPGKTRTGAIKEFNEADLDERKNLVKKWEEKSKKLEGKSEGNIVHRLLKRLIGSSANMDVEKPMEAWTVMNEITMEKRRNSLRLGHSAKTNVTKEAAEKGETGTLDRTQKIIGAVHDEKLKTKDGKLRLKAETLQATPGAVEGLMRTLKQVGIDDSNKAQLAADIQLVTQAGVEIIDEREFIAGELQRQLGVVRKKVAPVIKQALIGEGVNLDDKQLDEQLKTADWEEMGKEKIRRAA